MTQPSETQLPPGRVPPAAVPPWPAHPAPHASSPQLPVVPKAAAALESEAGHIALAVVGGLLAAGVGMFVVLPLWRDLRKPKPAPKRRGRPRKKAA